jgi:hypothetical protein
MEAPRPSSSQAASGDTHESALCPSCGTELLGTYCHRCGEKTFREHDLSLKHFFLHGLHEFTHLDSKIFATLRYLFTRPGFLTQEYVAGRRSHYMKPLSLFLVACTLLLLADLPIYRYDVGRLTQTDRSRKMDAAWEKLAALEHQPKELIVERVQATMHKMATGAQLANVLAMAVILALFYRRRYFTEHLVFAGHFLAFNFLALVLLSPLVSAIGKLHIKHLPVLLAEAGVFVAYLFFALRRVYPQGVAITMVKAIVTYGITQLLIVVTLIITVLVAVAFAAMS